MSNSLTPGSPTLWSLTAGHKLYNSNVFKNLASFKEEETLTKGRIVDRPYRANLAAENYTKGTAATLNDLSYTSDQLTINYQDDIYMYLDDIDKKQNSYDTMRLNAEEGGIRLANRIDARFLYEVVNANTGADDGDFGGSSGSGINLTVNNIDDVFGWAGQQFDMANIPMEERAMVISPFFKRVLWSRVGSKQSALGDKTAEFGSLGEYNGFKLYLSNQLTCSARWTPANNPSDEDTISIQGITFTFQSVIGTAAGNILQTTSTAVTIDNLVALINAGGVGDGTNYVSLSTANQRAVQMWVAVDGTTYIDVYVMGASSGLTLTASEAADLWSRQYQHIVAMRPKMAIDVVCQINPKVEFDRGVVNGKSGDFGLMLSVYGIKTFNQGKNEILNIKIDETLL